MIIVLHARRSAAALAEWHRRDPSIPLVLVLTGTDLYRDIQTDPDAQHSLQIATRLVLLQPAGLAELTPTLHSKAQVIYQSAASLKPVEPSSRRKRPFDAIMIGHLRAEKDPATFLRACMLLRDQPIRFTHIGGALDAGLAAQAEATARSVPHYRWLGDLPHAATRQRLKHSDLMAITSVMEGGANVIIEAVTSGIAIVASDISGNRGLLGDDYAGYFAVGDAASLAKIIHRVVCEPALRAQLQAQCALRRPLFTPERERAALLQLMDNCLQISRSSNR